jgi:hypothetical protein
LPVKSRFGAIGNTSKEHFGHICVTVALAAPSVGPRMVWKIGEVTSTIFAVSCAFSASASAPSARILPHTGPLFFALLTRLVRPCGPFPEATSMTDVPLAFAAGNADLNTADGVAETKTALAPPLIAASMLEVTVAGLF